MIGTSQLINTFSRPCFTDTTDIFKDGSGVALYGLDYDASDVGGASGKFGEAAIFNGSSSYINLGTGSSGLSGLLNQKVSQSVSFWMNTSYTGISGNSIIYSVYAGAGISLNVYYLTNGTLYFLTRYSNNSTTFTTTQTFNDSQWHHVAVTIDVPNLERKIYIDNSLVSTQSLPSASYGGSGTTGVALGTNGNFNTQYYKGDLDQVRIYNTALTSSQVTQLYQENNSTVGTHLFGCIANYNLDGSAKESMGTTAYDGVETDITYRYDGTPTNVDFGVGGKSLYGARFNGSSSEIEVSSNVININTISVSAWINLGTTSGFQQIVSNFSSSNTGWGLRINDGGYLSYNTAVGVITSSTALLANTWHHVALTIDSSGNSTKLYINGSEDSSTTYTAPTYGAGNTNFHIGSLGNLNTQYFNGSIDQVRIFSKALSSTEVGKLYGNGEGEIACAYTSTTDNLAYPIANTAYYKLDNNSKDSARSTGKFNEGAVFNGSSSYITSNSLPSIGTGDFTFSCWFNQNSGSSQGALFSTTTQWFAANGNVSPKVLMVTDDTVTKKGDTTYSQDTWNHAVFARESGVLKMYQNGTEVFSGAYTDSWDMTQFGIGVARAFGSRVYYFNGEIDQVRIYNTALSSTDVLNLYAETVSDTSTLSFPSGKTAIATYQLDGNSTDLSGNYNGTDTNITYAYDGTESNVEYRFGRYGQAAVFNGSTSYIESGISTNILNSDYTISFWGKSSNSSGGQTFINTNSGAVAFVRIDFSADGNLLFYHRNSASTTYLDYSIVPGMADGNWHHVVITKDNTSVKAYKDGSLVGTITSTSGTYSNSTTLQIGRNNYNANGANNFDGDIDQVRIYSTALTSSQVTQLYNEKPEVDTSNFKTVLYEGNGGTQYISNVGFEPDLVWIKSRSLAASNGIFDSVRGVANWLRSDGTDAEQYQRTNGYLNSFDSNGFTLVEGSSTHSTYTGSYETHQSGQTYVGWVFKGGGEAVLNEQGSIDSQVSANTEAGFSIVKYTGNGTGGTTVGHGLSSAPDIVITKGLDFPDVWLITGASIGNNDTNYLLFNTGAMGSSTTVGSSNATTLNIGTSTASNTNSKNFISYCFHSVPGYSKIGSYTGNGSSTGPIVTTGFEPKFIMIKRTDTSGYGWYIMDSARGMDGTTGKFLFANTSASEGTLGAGGLQPNSTGFQITDAGAGFNANLGTYIYMAFK